MSRVMASLVNQGISMTDTITSCQNAKRPMDKATAFLEQEAVTCPAGSTDKPTSDQEALSQIISPLLQAAVDPNSSQWGATNVEQGLIGGPAADGVSSMMRTLSYSAFMWVPVSGILVFFLTLAVHAAVVGSKAARPRFEARGLEQRLVSYQHALFVLVFGLQIVPYTYLAASFFFQQW